MTNPIDDFTRSAGLYDFTSKAAIDYVEGRRRVVDEDEEIERLAALSDTLAMNDITRDELNAKLETIEVKMDARVEAVSSKIDGFLAAQAERDKRYDLMAERITKAAEGAEEAAKQAATVKANYWAAVVVQIVAVVAILVGAYFANQANVLGVMQTTMAAIQAGKDGAAPQSKPPNSPTSP